MPSTDFVVKLEDFRLSAAQKKRLGQAINAAVDAELASQGFGGAALHRIPPDWLGKYLKQIADKQFNQFLAGK